MSRSLSQSKQTPHEPSSMTSETASALEREKAFTAIRSTPPEFADQEVLPCRLLVSDIEGRLVWLQEAVRKAMGGGEPNSLHEDMFDVAGDARARCKALLEYLPTEK